MLVYKYSQYHTNPEEIVKWTINGAVNGENKFLDEKLEQLRSIDGLAKYVFPLQDHKSLRGIRTLDTV